MRMLRENCSRRIQASQSGNTRRNRHTSNLTTLSHVSATAITIFTKLQKHKPESIHCIQTSLASTRLRSCSTLSADIPSSMAATPISARSTSVAYFCSKASYWLLTVCKTTNSKRRSFIYTEITHAIVFSRRPGRKTVMYQKCFPELLAYTVVYYCGFILGFKLQHQCTFIVCVSLFLKGTCDGG